MGIISDSLFFKRHKIKENIEERKYKFLVRAYAFKDSFWSEFYEFSIENACADMYDLFEVGKRNSLRRYIKNINDLTGAKYYKMMAFIHFTEFVKQRDMELAEKGYRAFNEIFKPDKTEKRFFDLLMRCFMEFSDEFKQLRSAVFLKYTFSITEEGDNILAFTGSFCYNSYNKFMDSFNRFMTVERRLEVAE
ncbi:MAG: hypothetical protein E7235_03575 [Lachnospiraceae bacterium]|nr:hypothetical protein [Lachnospiraceae bacterium]